VSELVRHPRHAELANSTPGRTKMTSFREQLYRLNLWILSSVAGVLTVVQIGLCVLRSHPEGLPVLRYVGYVIWTAAVVFAVLPIFTLKRRGQVPKGQSYMKTTTVVTSGVYSLVRHPQGGLAWLLMNLAVMLVGQTWPIALLGGISMLLVYLDAYKTDQYCIEKFGQEYQRYMETVPRVNVVAGATRLLRRKAAGGRELDRSN
jgi:protein-S-isoprenylcysteine O-methyltransferase Ste14